MAGAAVRKLSVLSECISPERDDGPSKRETYLVTGASGFLGQALIRRLLADGHGVRAMCRRTESIDGVSDVVCMDMGASVAQWQAAIDGCAGVFHLAWSTVPGSANADPLLDAQTNVLGALGLLEALRGFPDVPLVFVSSGGTVYGKAETLPIAETHQLRPLTAYGASKIAVEQYMLLYRRTWQVDARVARLSNPFGPGQNVAGRLGAASIFAARALAGEKIEIWGDGRAIRDYIYIDDAVGGLIATLRAPKECFSEFEPVLNIGSGRGVSLRELIALIAQIIERPVDVAFEPSRGFDVTSNVLDVTLARTLLGWSQTVTFEEGMARYISYLKENWVKTTNNDVAAASTVRAGGSDGPQLAGGV